MTILAPASPHPTYRARPEYRQPRITPRQRRQQQHALRNVRRVDPAHAQVVQGRIDQAMTPRPKLRPVERVAFEGRTYT